MVNVCIKYVLSENTNKVFKKKKKKGAVGGGEGGERRGCSWGSGGSPRG